MRLLTQNHQRCEPFALTLRLGNDIARMLRNERPTSVTMTGGRRKFGWATVARPLTVARTSLERRRPAPTTPLARSCLAKPISTYHDHGLQTPSHSYFRNIEKRAAPHRLSPVPRSLSLSLSLDVPPLQYALSPRQEPLGTEQTLHEHHPILGVWPPADCPPVRAARDAVAMQRMWICVCVYFFIKSVLL